MMAKVVFCVLSVIQVVSAASESMKVMKVQISRLQFVDASSFWDRYIEPTSAVLSITTNYVDSCAQRGQPGLYRASRGCFVSPITFLFRSVRRCRLHLHGMHGAGEMRLDEQCLAHDSA